MLAAVRAECHLLLLNFDIYEMTMLLYFSFHFLTFGTECLMYHHDSYLQSPNNASFLKVLWS